MSQTDNFIKELKIARAKFSDKKVSQIIQEAVDNEHSMKNVNLHDVSDKKLVSSIKNLNAKPHKVLKKRIKVKTK